MKAYLVVCLLCFIAGLTAKSMLNLSTPGQSATVSQANPEIRSEAPKTLTELTTNKSPTILEGVDSTASNTELPWYQRDYSGNWQEMFTQLDNNPEEGLEDRTEFLKLMIKLLQLPASEQFYLLEEAIDAKQARICYYLMNSMAHQEPYTALSFLQSIDLSQLSQGGAVIRGFINGFIDYSPQEAWRWLQAPGDNNIKALAGDNLRDMEYRIVRSAAQNPEQQMWALAATRESKDPQTMRMGEWIVMRNMLKDDQERTLDFAINEYRQTNDKSLFNTAIRSWAREDISSTVNFMVNNPDLMDAQNTTSLAVQLKRADNQESFDLLYAGIQDEELRQRVNRSVARFEPKD